MALDREEDQALRLDHQLCFPLYACARRITQQYTPYLKPLGLTYTQYLVLLVLWEVEACTVGELCRRLYLDSGTLTPVLKKMEGQGLLTRGRDKDDERVVWIRLTEAGEALKEQAREIPPKIGACVPLEPADAEKLYTLLYQMLQMEYTSSR